MQRVTKKTLQTLVTLINRELGRPVEMFATAPGVQPVRFNPGHFLLDHNHTGYALEEQSENGSSTYQHTGRLTAREMHLVLRGIIKGMMFRAELPKE